MTAIVPGDHYGTTTYTPEKSPNGESNLYLAAEDGAFIVDESGLYYILLGFGFGRRNSGDGIGSATYGVGSLLSASIPVGDGVTSATLTPA